MADRQADQIFVDTVGQTSNSHFLRSHHNHQHCHLMAMEITAKKYKYTLSSGNASSIADISHHTATIVAVVFFFKPIYFLEEIMQNCDYFVVNLRIFRRSFYSFK